MGTTQYRLQWQRNHPESRQRSIKKYYKNNQHKATDANRRIKYNLTKQEFSDLISRYSVCAICGRPPVKRRLCIDHDHVTGKIRGLLCNSCNRMLGYGKDDPVVLRLAADYLEANR